MFIAALVTIAKKWKELFSSAGVVYLNVVYLKSGMLLSHKNSDEILIHATVWMHLEKYYAK